MNRYIKTDEYGSIVESVATGRLLGKPWRKLTQAEREKTIRGIHRFYVDGDNVIREKKKIRLVRGSPRFPADGVTEMSISVRGRNLSQQEPVRVMVNDEEYEISLKDHLTFTAQTPGEFLVRLIDPRYYVPVKQFSVMAYDPEEEPDDAQG